MDVNSTTFERIEDKKRRNKYLANQIKLGLSFQLRALRKDRDLTQKDLADLLGTQQTVISRIENHNASKLSIPTLLKMAEVFDVGVVVRFEPIDIVADWYDNLSPLKLSPRKSEEIVKELIEQAKKQNRMANNGEVIKQVQPMRSRRSRKLKRSNTAPQQPSLFSELNAEIQGNKPFGHANVTYLQDYMSKRQKEEFVSYRSASLQGIGQKRRA